MRKTKSETKSETASKPPARCRASEARDPLPGSGDAAGDLPGRRRAASPPGPGILAQDPEMLPVSLLAAGAQLRGLQGRDPLPGSGTAAGDLDFDID